MGLLDDAIKEHLELKRRRGADAGEISRLESEALGPVPRSAEGVPDMSDTFEPPREEPAVATGDASAEAAAPPAPFPASAPPPAADPWSGSSAPAHEPLPIVPPAAPERDPWTTDDTQSEP